MALCACLGPGSMSSSWVSDGRQRGSEIQAAETRGVLKQGGGRTGGNKRKEPTEKAPHPK